MFPKNYSILLVGDPSAGMFEFCCYLASTYIRSGERVVFVEADTYPDQVWRQMHRFGIDVQEHESGDTLAIVDCYSPLTESTGPVASLDLISRKVLDGVDKVGGLPVRVVFNSLTPLFLHYEPKEVGKFFRDLSAKITLNGVMTSAVHRQMLDERDIALLSSIADGMIEMMIDESFRRHVRIKHMRGLKVAPRWVPFELEAEAEAPGGAFLGWRRT